MPRLVRRAPLVERIKAYLDPYDFLLWLSEELNDDAFDEWLKDWAFPTGVALNIVFVLLRGANRSGNAGLADDVFSDPGGSGWFAWFATLLSHLLTLLCCANAFFTFFRKRHYRLFEQPVDETPPTPSAHRVRVDSSPASTPLGLLKDFVWSASAASRSYPDAEREVWELRMWDPRPSNLALFTWFSPGHLLLYYALLPPTALDPRPSVTVFTALAFSAVLSFQLSMLKISFTQQAKDSALIHGQVMNEYDTKYVRPHLNRPVRDVGVQTRESSRTPRGTRVREVDIYTPTTIVNRGFHVNPNPNYASQYDPDNLSDPNLSAHPHSTTATHGSATSSRRESFNPNLSTPRYLTSNLNPNVNGSASYSQLTTSSTGTQAQDFSSPLKPHHEKPNLQQRRPSSSQNLGVSPLRKTASTNAIRGSVSPYRRMSGTSGNAVNGDGDRTRDQKRRETTGRSY